MRRYIITGLALVIVLTTIVILHPTRPQHVSDDNTTDSYEYYYNENDTAVEEEDSLLPDDLNSILADNKTVPLDLVPDSITVLVNRVYPLPSDYVPLNLVVPDVKFSFAYLNDKRKMRKVAATALEKLFKAAQEKNLELVGVSGYRSYARQKEIYDRNILTRGQTATDTVSAKPGSSEHQTGLTIDVSAQSVNYRLDQSFGDTEEGRWLAKNAHLYGFIIRYPYGKTEVTGYSYEPWHIRFVGVAVATYLYNNNLTMEEYYGVEAVTEDTPDNAVDVEDPDTVKYATPRPTRRPTPRPSAGPDNTKKPKSTEKPENTKKPKSTRKPGGDTSTYTPASTEKPDASRPTAAPTAPTEKPENPNPATLPPAPTEKSAPTGQPGTSVPAMNDENTGSSQ